MREIKLQTGLFLCSIIYSRVNIVNVDKLSISTYF